MALFQRSWTLWLAIALALLLLIAPGQSVKHENFKKCSQSGFCSRNRAYADEATQKGSTWRSPYALDASTLTLDGGELTGTIWKTTDLSTGETVSLPLKIAFLESGAARVTVDEEKRQKGDIELRHDSKIRKERYNEAENWTIVGGLEKSQEAAVRAVEGEKGITRILFGIGGKHEALIRHDPFSIDFLRDGQTHVKLNDRGFMSMEHWRRKTEKPTVELKEGEEQEVIQASTELDVDESTWWDESFGGNTDTKPRGPESVAMDISFPGYEHVYGIPEHTGPMSLKETRGTDGEEGKYTEPYRLYNLDVFEYILDSPMTLYGSIPYMQAHRKDSTVGVFWLNAAETWVDIEKSKTAANAMSLGLAGSVSSKTHWFSESGLIDVFVLLGPTPEDNSKVFAGLTGYTAMPQIFSIAYHQCRWNYVTDEDVKDVDKKFDKANIPYDVIWLDLEYTDDRKYFTWDPLTFTDPLGMQKQLDQHERKLVTLIDPHIKKEGGDYKVIEEMKSKDLAVKNKNNEMYDGWCWPGASHWVDCFNPAAVTWWKSLFKYNKFVGSAANTFIWNDMNEPSVFNGPETTMPKDNVHHGGWEHRDVHNINGMTFHNATFLALQERDGAKKAVDQKRPFVLTRAFFAGSQRSAAMWTGDNQADWGHLAGSFSMILQNGISGFPFCGADIGGFFGNPSKELLTRWYQTGIWYPFMRAHAHIDTRRREPYLAGEPYTSIIAQAVRLRYSLLPAWYTAFHTAATTGLPIVRPNWYTHPHDEAGFGVDDQLYLGNTGLLVKPVTTEGGDSVSVYISDDRTYYDYFSYTPYSGSAGRTQTIAAPLEKIPVLMRAGHIFPRRDRPRRSAGLMKNDPFTLVIVLDSQTRSAEGELYLDDGETYAFTEGAYIHRSFSFAATTHESSDSYSLISTDLVRDEHVKAKAHTAYMQKTAPLSVEKILIIGAPKEWQGKETVSISEEGSMTSKSEEGVRLAPFEYISATKESAAWAVVKKPGVSISKGWKITF